MGLDDILEYQLDCFCEYFKSKGIVSVEYQDYQIDQNANHKKLSIPFIKQSPTKKYTLVLDLDETLIHYNQNISE